VAEVAEKICPYCQGKILAEEAVVHCSQCGVPHHEECWKENGGCTVYGCKGWAIWPGINLAPAQERTFEPVDLTKLKSREFVLSCPVCKARVTKGMEQCGVCGYDLPNWMIGRYVIELPWWGVALLALVGAGVIALGVIVILGY